jgi:hypothetical protein
MQTLRTSAELGLGETLQATDNPVVTSCSSGEAAADHQTSGGDVESGGGASSSAAPRGLLSDAVEDPTSPPPSASGLDALTAAPAHPGPIERMWLKTGASATCEAAAAKCSVLASQLWAHRNARLACAAAGALLALLVIWFHFLADWRRLTALLGMALFLMCCAVEVTLPSKSPGVDAGVRVRAGLSWSRAASSLSLQLLFGVLIVYTPMFSVFAFLGDQVNDMLAYSQAGANFAWTGDSALGPFVNVPQTHYAAMNISRWEMDGHGNPRKQAPVAVLSPATVEGAAGADTVMAPLQGGFALNVLPSIIFFSALVEFANHIGVLPICMRFFAAIFCSFTRCSAPEAIASAANVFVGMTNAPLLIKPFVRTSTYST